jgi:class 3 adenylate cyclase/tetratricopeptide (TPR) repeat protein
VTHDPLQARGRCRESAVAGIAAAYTRRMPVCAACSQRNPDGARFCLSCGTSLGANGPARAATRKLVTVVFCDIVDSTRLGERLDPESLRDVLERYFDAVRPVVERHGGVVEKFIGDAVMAVFGVPLMHEDDAVRAVRAAWEARAAIATLDAELERERGLHLVARMGLHTGEVVTSTNDAGDQRLVTGDAVNIAARLEQGAAPGEIWLGEATYALVRDAVTAGDAGSMSIRGRAEPLRVWRLDAVRARTAGVRRRLDTPLVGRADEVAMLRQAFERTRRDRHCHLVTVLGEPGLGKSRLVEALQADLALDADVHVGQCLPYGEGITYWPLREVVHSVAGIRVDDSRVEAHARLLALSSTDDWARITAIVAAAIGLTQSPVGEPAEVAWAMRRLFEAVFADRPAVLVFEDVHWADPGMLKLVAQLCERTRDASILVVCTARPELRVAAREWPAGNLSASTFLLAPLSDDECRRLVRLFPNGGELDEDTQQRVVTASEGNPLFCEQLVAMLALDGREAADRPVPTSISTLLAARLDQLSPSERRILQTASVEGRVFHRSALLDLVAELAGIDDVLDALVRYELISPHASIFAGDQAFRFGHLLIRDAAYDALPKRDRARFHEHIARWLERLAEEGRDEHAEIVGYHFEQAQRWLSELGPLDDHGQALARRGGEVLADAGRRAAASGETLAAASLLGRARRLLPADAARARDLDPLRALALIESGDLVLAKLELERAVAEAEAARDDRAAHRARIELLALCATIGGAESRSSRDVSLAAVAAIPLLETARDNAGLARAWQLSGDVHWDACHWGERAVALERALAYARRAGDAHEVAVLTRWLALGLVYDATPVERAIARCGELLEETSGPFAESAVIVASGSLHAMANRFVEARALYARARSLDAELGSRFSGAAHRLHGALIATLSGDLVTAERELRAGYDAYDAMGEQGVRCSVAAALGRVLYGLERFADAAAVIAEAERITPAGDVSAEMLCRATRAKLLARSGACEPGLRMAESALALSQGTDMLNEQAHVLLDLAEVVQLDGRPRDSVTFIERAGALYAAKGNIAGAEIAARAHAKMAAVGR